MIPLIVALAFVSVPGSMAGEAIAVEASSIALNASEPSQQSVGQLAFRGGLLLRSRDPRFGGLSDLVVSADRQRLAAVSDEGGFVEARLVYDARGFLSGLEDAVLHTLRDTRSRPLRGKEKQDAESLVQMVDGTFVVGFERWQRIWRYKHGPDGNAQPIRPPGGLGRVPSNGGLETLVLFPPDRLLALTEESVRDGVVEGWLGTGGRFERLGFRADGDLRPSGGCRLPSGDLMVLERHYSKETGVTSRLRRVPASSIVAGAVLEGTAVATLASPLTVDNFEGLACTAGDGGETLLYLLSDDNFSSSQRTLLLMFALTGGS